MSTAPRHEPSTPGLRPVFLHAGWRSGGTWLWSRFRTLPRTLCYYEPLHEALAGLTPEAIDALHAAAWRSGHPALRRPYFDEFRPLLDETTGGVSGFHGDFAVRHFFAATDDEIANLADYLVFLLDHAARRGLQPVLKFCRTLGRIGWMQRHFPQALHVAVLRNPIEQFASARRQFLHSGNTYFLAMPLYLLAVHLHHPRVAAALRHLEVAPPPMPPDTGVHEGLAICDAAIRRSGALKAYQTFLAFWTLTAASVPEAIDLSIDIDLIKLSPDYRGQCEADLARLTGLPIELSDVKAGVDHGLLDRAGLSRSELWACHRAAEAVLTELGGPTWADRPTLARAGAMLSYASVLAMDGAITLHARSFAQVADWESLCAQAASLADSARRAERAEQQLAQREQQLACIEQQRVSIEQQLAAVHASGSWAVTTPLRWLRAHLP